MAERSNGGRDPTASISKPDCRVCCEFSGPHFAESGVSMERSRLEIDNGSYTKLLPIGTDDDLFGWTAQRR